MPLASRVRDAHVCSHGVPPVVTGCLTVKIGYQLAARVGDTCKCGDAIVRGSPTVIVGHKQAARIGDPTAHPGALVEGCPTVVIGDTAQIAALRAAAASGKPFVAECERAKREQGGPP